MCFFFLNEFILLQSQLSIRSFSSLYIIGLSIFSRGSAVRYLVRSICNNCCWKTLSKALIRDTSGKTQHKHKPIIPLCLFMDDCHFDRCQQCWKPKTKLYKTTNIKWIKDRGKKQMSAPVWPTHVSLSVISHKESDLAVAGTSDLVQCHVWDSHCSWKLLEVFFPYIIESQQLSEPVKPS